MNIFQSAIANWPEDEAAAEAAHINGLISDQEEPDYIRHQVDKLPAHWSRVFAGESDAAELMARFSAAFNQLVPAAYHLPA